MLNEKERQVKLSINLACSSNLGQCHYDQQSKMTSVCFEGRNFENHVNFRGTKDYRNTSEPLSVGSTEHITYPNDSPA